jgi:hypothetical protein
VCDFSSLVGRGVHLGVLWVAVLLVGAAVLIQHYAVILIAEVVRLAHSSAVNRLAALAPAAGLRDLTVARKNGLPP